MLNQHFSLTLSLNFILLFLGLLPGPSSRGTEAWGMEVEASPLQLHFELLSLHTFSLLLHALSLQAVVPSYSGVWSSMNCRVDICSIVLSRGFREFLLQCLEHLLLHWSWCLQYFLSHFPFSLFFLPCSGLFFYESNFDCCVLSQLWSQLDLAASDTGGPWHLFTEFIMQLPDTKTWTHKLKTASSINFMKIK